MRLQKVIESEKKERNLGEILRNKCTISALALTSFQEYYLDDRGSKERLTLQMETDTAPITLQDPDYDYDYDF